MALGRLSAFNTIPRPSIRGSNVTPSATGFESLFTTPSSGSFSDANPIGVSPVTGLTSQANTTFGNFIGILSGLAGLPSATGLLGGLVSDAAGPLAGAGAKLGGAIGAKAAGIPTNLGDLVTMALNSLQSTGRFPLSLNPAAPASTTLGQTGLNAGQLANALGSLSQSQSMAGLPATADPTTPFGLANITSADLANMGDVTFGSLGLGRGGSSASAPAPADMGFVAANPSGAGVVGAPPGGYTDAQGNLSNANISFAIPDNANFFGEGNTSGLGGVPGGAGSSAVGPTGTGTGSATSGVPGGSVVGDSTGIAGPGGGTGGSPGTGVSGPGVASGSGEAGIGTAGVGSGGPGSGPGEGDAGATGGAGTGEGADGSGNYHEGGFVDLERDGMGGNTKNSPDEGEKEVDATLEEGEFVVNKQAAGRFGPLLNTLNNLGRNAQLKNMLKSIIEGGAQMGFEALGKIK